MDGKNANLSPSLSIIDGHIRSSDGAFFVAAAASSSNYAEIEALLLPPPPLHAPLPAFCTTQVEILGFQLVSISLFLPLFVLTCASTSAGLVLPTFVVTAHSLILPLLDH